MSYQQIFTQLRAYVAAVVLMSGIATGASAQDITCQIFTGQFDPLSVQSAVSEPFVIEVEAIQTNGAGDRLKKGTGVTEVEFLEVGGINFGEVVAEANANFKRLTNDPTITCPNDATLRGPGFLELDGFPDSDLVIRANSQLMGRPRVGTVIAGPVGDAEINSVHRVGVNLRYTAQGFRNNMTPRYDRGTANTRNLYEIVEGAPPGQGEDVLLICTCLDEIGMIP